MVLEALVDKFTQKANSLQAKKPVLKQYIKDKLDEEDFHAVSDAACDLRDIDSEIKALEWAVGATESV